MSDDFYDNVRVLDDGVHHYDSSDRDVIADFPLKVGNSPVIMVHEPDAGVVMDIEESTSTRQVLRLFLGDDYATIEDHLAAQKPDVLVDIAGDLSRHFKLQPQQARVNRAERRRQQRRR